MILFALGSLLLGILCGYFLFPPEAVPVMDRLMSYALMLLLLSVGIEVGTNKTVFRKIREYNVRILVIPFGVAVGSIAGGLLLGFFLVGQSLVLGFFGKRIDARNFFIGHNRIPPSN